MKLTEILKQKKVLVAISIAVICIIVVVAVIVFNNKNTKQIIDTPTETTTVETDSEVEQSEISDIPVEDGDFIYKNENKTEIIGLSESGRKTMDLIFPEHVTKISNIFIPSDSLLHTVYFMNLDVELENVSFANSRVEEIKNWPNTITDISDNMFNGCTYLTTFGSTKGVITIPDTVTTIGNGAFAGCTSIKEVDFNNVTEIKDYAFQGCVNLTALKWTKVETIGDAAFFAAGMTEVKLPDTCKTLGSIVFFRCTNLISLNINNVESVNQELCRECTALTDFYANKDFTATVAEISDNTSEDEINAYETLFIDCNNVVLHLNKKSSFVEYLNTHPNSNFTVVNE